MPESREPPAAPDAPPPDDRVVPTEVERPDGDGALVSEGPGALTTTDGQPEALREIAHAFRMNAEALHTLKQMQVDLTRTVQRGDRSELVLQSTRALNDTFRNLSSVQRELLSRLDGNRGGRGPLVPLMILGLLVVVVGGVYVILEAVQKSAQSKPGLDPTEIARRERDSWKEGRREGALHAEREVQRLQEMLDESKDRARTLEQDLQTKLETLSEIDRNRRAAELERDQFAGQVRKAQNEVLAKKALEDEVAALRSQITAANQIALDMQVDLDRQRRVARHLRDRMADYGMDLPEEDPPYRGPMPQAAGTNDGAPAPQAPPEDAPASAPPVKPVNLLTAGREGERPAPPPGTPAAREPQPAPTLATDPTPVFQPAPSAPAGQPQAGVPRRMPGQGLPPPVLRHRSVLDTDPTQVRRVRTVVNQLLDASTGPDGETWRVTRIDGVAADRLGGVIVLHYDAAGRLLDAIEARDLRITVDKDERAVEFELIEGVRVRRGERTRLPAAGTRVVVAKGDASGLWAGSGLTVIRSR